MFFLVPGAFFLVPGGRLTTLIQAVIDPPHPEILISIKYLIRWITQPPTPKTRSNKSGTYPRKDLIMAAPQHVFSKVGSPLLVGFIRRRVSLEALHAKQVYFRRVGLVSDLAKFILSLAVSWVLTND